MLKGYWEKSFNKDCESIYLHDRENKRAITFEIVRYQIKSGDIVPSTDIEYVDLEILKALAEALQAGGYIPQSAVDAELKATKYHLEDMRKLTLEKESP